MNNRTNISWKFFVDKNFLFLIKTATWLSYCYLIIPKQDRAWTFIGSNQSSGLTLSYKSSSWLSRYIREGTTTNVIIKCEFFCQFFPLTVYAFGFAHLVFIWEEKSLIPQTIHWFRILEKTGITLAAWFVSLSSCGNKYAAS